MEPSDLLQEIQDLRSLRDELTVIVDDDPTGTQTLSDIDVVTAWDAETLGAAVAESTEFFVLANTRAHPEAEALRLANEIGVNVAHAAAAAGKRLTLISRADSTLRGHFPAEVEMLAQASGTPDAQIVLCPAFFEMGRVTVDDVHYVEEKGTRVPVAETPFARDASFGYHSSNLRDWVIERSGGAIGAKAIAGLSAHGRDASRVAQEILDQPDKRVFVVSAGSYDELEAVALGALQAETGGATLIYRSAASLVRARLGRGAATPVTASSLRRPAPGALRGGLVVVGSHVPLSSRQLECVLSLPDVAGVELRISELWERQPRSMELARARNIIDDTMACGGTAVLYTSRAFFASERHDAFAVSQTVSGALVEVVRDLARVPAFVIGKGGTTSSDLATAALGIRRATVLGQIVTGVSVWRIVSGAAAGREYVVFPGNVGDEGSLAAVVAELRRAMGS